MKYLQHLPSFGPYLEKRNEAIAGHYKSTDILGTEFTPDPVRPPLVPQKPVPSVKVRKIYTRSREAPSGASEACA